MKHRLKFFIWLVILLAVMAAIFFFSSQPAEQSQKLSDGLLDKLGRFLSFIPWFKDNGGKKIRKLAHGIEFMCLGLVSCLLFNELFTHDKNKTVRCGVFSPVFCFLYACSDEIHQLFVPGRSCEWRDILIDCSGALVGAAAALVFVYLTDGKAGCSDHEGSSS